MSGSGDSSSAEVQREAETERAELASTLGQLRENLKPANVVDEVMASAKVTTSEVTDWVWSVARRNPIPATLIGLGAAMLLGVGQKLRSRAATVDHDWDGDNQFAHAENSGVGASPGPAAYSRFSPGERMRSPNTSASVAASGIESSARDLRSISRGFAARTSSSGTPHVSGDTKMSQYGRSRDRISQSVSRLFEEQPLVLAALGVAVGAAIGAAIPGTEAESRLMGDASAQVRTRAQEIASAEYAHLKETASSTVEDLKRTASDHGVSTENLSGFVQDVGARVKDAAGGVADHAAGSAGLKT